MAFLPVLLMLFVLFGFILVFIVSGIKKGASGIKVMLLGINITMLGGIIAVDPDSSLGGLEYFIVLLGLLVSILGFQKND